jgi:hypothetical protein
MLNFDPEVSVKYDLVAIACLSSLALIESISGFAAALAQARTPICLDYLGLLFEPLHHIRNLNQCTVVVVVIKQMQMNANERAISTTQAQPQVVEGWDFFPQK